MARINYKSGVFRTLKVELSKEIISATESSPEMRGEIRKIFQRANRRIQNIQAKGLLSPAVTALGKGDVKGFTKFSMRQDWQSLKIEYGRAVSFLRQPTSTATGTRQYNEHLKSVYNLTDKEFALMAKSLTDKITSISDSNFVEKYLFNYKDFTGDLEQAAADVSDQIESDSVNLANALQEDIREQADRISNDVADQISSILDAFNKFDL